MAKETKKAVETTAVVDENNVMDQVKNGNLLKQENVKAALEKIEQEKDEKQQAEARRMIMCAQYTNIKELIQLRARRREEKTTKEALVKSKENLDNVLAGKITPTEYRTQKSTLAAEKRKAMNESEEQLSKDLRELRESYAGNFSWDWD